jgi:hypothetical protein
MKIVIVGDPQIGRLAADRLAKIAPVVVAENPNVLDKLGLLGYQNVTSGTDALNTIVLRPPEPLPDLKTAVRQRDDWYRQFEKKRKK